MRIKLKWKPVAKQCNVNMKLLSQAPQATLLKKETDYGGLSPVWRSNQDRGFQRQLPAWRNGSKKQYSTFITKWQNFCNQRQVNFIQPSFACPWLPYNTIPSRPHIHCINTARSALSSYYIRGWEMCRKTRIIVQTDERNLPGKTSNTDVHGNLRCVYCSFIPSILIPCGYIVFEGTYAETCCVDFIRAVFIWVS